MRLIYAADKQASLRKAWTDVIYLNVIMALKLLLEVLENIETTELQRRQAALEDSSPILPGPLRRFHSSACFTMCGMSSGTSAVTNIRQSSRVLLARMQLAPFLSIETELRKKLGAFERDVNGDHNTPPADRFSKGSTHYLPPRSILGSDNLRRHQYAADLLLRAGWQDELVRSASLSSDKIDSHSVAESTASGWSARRRPLFPTKLTRRVTTGGEERGTALQQSGRYTISQKEDDPPKLLTAILDGVEDLWDGSSSKMIKDRLFGADSAA